MNPADLKRARPEDQGADPRPGAGLVARLANIPGGPLILLRAFLGVTFTFAGCEKLASPTFFRADAPGSFLEQLHGSILTSPLHHLLSPATHAAVPIALTISLAEIAVGLGTFFGLFGRVAALGGFLLSLTFFLTVSFNDTPYYYGPDIVFCFAWTTLAIGGSGPLSLDMLLARRTEAAGQRVRIGRSRVPIAPVGADAAASAPGTTAAAKSGQGKLGAGRPGAGRLDRRTFLERSAVASGVGVLGLSLAGIASLLRGSAPADAAAGSTATPSADTTTTTVPSDPGSTAPGGATPAGVRILPANVVQVGDAIAFTDPKQGIPAFAVQPERGTYRAFSAICTHAGCEVNFVAGSEVFACPCHGSVFNASTGAVINGPAPLPLPEIPIAEGADGSLYVDG